jgi:tRNA threonylcarbamoyl adenosine modification protein (Sua5/YciO/YrdC/YwlC family)
MVVSLDCILLAGRLPFLVHTARVANLSAELLKISPENPDPVALRYAADFICRGELVAIPTDTFYGIAADPFNLAAVDQIYRVKGRPETRALPILVNTTAQAVSLARDVPYTFHKLAAKFWPGPLTLLVEASSGVPLKVTAHTGNVALRWPKSAIVNALIDLLKGPITGTSGNISGQPACACAIDLLEQLGDRLPLIIDAGETPGNLASTIVKLDGDDWAVMREGVITEQEIRAAIEDDTEA